METTPTVKRIPHLIEMIQWFTNGDHGSDACEYYETDGILVKGEGKVVRYFNNPFVPEDTVCGECGHTMRGHGWIDSELRPPVGLIVCPGDIVGTDESGVYHVFRIPVRFPHRAPLNATIPPDLDDEALLKELPF
jgi:hypothetical protein